MMIMRMSGVTNFSCFKNASYTDGTGRDMRKAAKFLRTYPKVELDDEGRLVLREEDGSKKRVLIACMRHFFETTSLWKL